MHNHPCSLNSPVALTAGDEQALVCYMQCWKDTCGGSMSSVHTQRQSIDPRHGLLQRLHQMIYCKHLCLVCGCVCVLRLFWIYVKKTKRNEI